MIIKSTKEELIKYLTDMIENALTKPITTYPPSNKKLHKIQFAKQHLDLVKKICKDKNLAFELSEHGPLTLPPTYEGYITECTIQ